MKFPFHLHFNWKGMKSNNSSSRRKSPKEIRRKMTLPSRTRSPSDSFVEVSRRLANSTEGRFTIIDERSKDSESFDDASSTDSDDHKFSRSFVTLTNSNSPIPAPLTVPRLANSTYLPLPQIKMTNSSTGRFRVGKVLGDPGATSLLQIPATSEKRFKRGRWDCKEWYDQNDKVTDSKRQAKSPLAMWNDISFPVPIVITNNNSIHHPQNYNNNIDNMLNPMMAQNDQQQQHSSSSASSIHSHPPLAHEITVFSMEEQSDDSDRENNLPEFGSSLSPIMDIQNSEETSVTPSTSLDKPNSLPLPPVINIPTTRSKLFGTSPDILSGRATPLEMQLHYGLERSLSGGGGNIFYPLFDGSMSSSANGNGIRGSSISSQD